MQEQNGPNPSSPQPQPSRGPAAYVPRQASYFSNAPRQAEPSMTEAAEAAQRLVQPTLTPPTPAFKPTPPAPRPVNAGFDITPPQPQQPISAPAAPPSVQEQAVAPAPSPFLTPVSAAPAKLPTDLPSVVMPETAPSPQSTSPLKLPSRKVIAGMTVLLLIVGVSGVFAVSRHGETDDTEVKGASRTSFTKQDKEGGLGLDALPTEDGNAPSVQYYRTASSYPRVVRIAKTKTEARVLALSIAANGALKAPGNIFDAGWYKDSAKPGEDGAIVIDAHATGPTKPGVFKNINTLTKGDKIELERGDGKTYTYTVKEVKTFEADKLDMSSVMVPYVPGKQGLNLITAGGKFNNDTNSFEPRTVVYAVL